MMTTLKIDVSFSIKVVIIGISWKYTC